MVLVLLDYSMLQRDGNHRLCNLIFIQTNISCYETIIRNLISFETILLVSAMIYWSENMLLIFHNLRV
jgi:hypothetical protein